MAEIDEYIVHKDYLKKLTIFFSRSFIDSVDCQRRTKLLEEKREERIRIFYSIFIPSLLTKCSNDVYICLFEECKTTKICFPNEIGLVRHCLRRHKKEIPACGNFLMTTNCSLKYNIVCEQCIDITIEIDETIVLSGSTSSTEEDSDALIASLCQRKAIKYTEDWHDLEEAKTWSQPFDDYYFSEDDNESFRLWRPISINDLKRNISTESFKISRKK